MASQLIASQVFNVISSPGYADSLWRFMPAVMFVLADNEHVPIREALVYERQLVERPTDRDVRAVYADWLKEHDCETREQQVRHELAAMLTFAEATPGAEPSCPGWAQPTCKPHLETYDVEAPHRLRIRLAFEWEYTGLVEPRGST